MKANLFFGTCGGETVRLTNVGYTCENRFQADYRGLLNEAIPSQVEKYAQASGGGLPTVWAYAAGKCACGQVHFANRRIVRSATPSNHKCSGKCRSSKGPNCECSCGGKNHGAN